MIEGFIIPANKIASLRARIDICNAIDPILIRAGENAGNYFIDTDILIREPRLRALIGSDENSGRLKSAGVTRVVIDEENLRANTMT